MPDSFSLRSFLDMVVTLSEDLRANHPEQVFHFVLEHLGNAMEGTEKLDLDHRTSSIRTLGETCIQFAEKLDKQIEESLKQ